MNRLWCVFFMIWPVLAIWCVWIAPGQNWWFPYNLEAATTLGLQIDGLFYLILVIVTVVFIATQIVIGYTLWKGADSSEGKKAWYSHGNHNLEVIWTIAPTGILLFISLFQLDVVADIRLKNRFPAEARIGPVAEVTARQFEWRIRYPSPATSRSFKTEADVKDWLEHPRKDDLYTVNDLHIPSGRPVQIRLRSGDVQHSFFVPEFRVKQDAVPGLVIPVWFEVQNQKPYDKTLKGVSYDLLCAELCGWGHYKMKGRVVAHPPAEFDAFLRELKVKQNEDGFRPSKIKQKN
ncbi:MAG: cytochrome c oxidase subunit II [Planctomycetes bacterium]|nr:cytochrome c oxidase subunit II [Planctomycetota bacterium]